MELILIGFCRLTKDFAASARDDAIALAHDKERQKNFINASKSMSAGLPKLVAAIKSNNPPLIQKCAEFLNNACIVMDAARTGTKSPLAWFWALDFLWASFAVEGPYFLLQAFCARRPGPFVELNYLFCL